MDRRTFVFTSSGAAIGSLVVPGLAEADAGDHFVPDPSGLISGVPKPLRHLEVPGFLSAAQIAPHHSAHYGGAVKTFASVEQALERSYAAGSTVDPLAVERMKTLQSSRGNSVVLHELYFDGLALRATSPGTGLREAIAKRFGSLDRWAADFVTSAKSAAGWAMLVRHPVNARLYNVVSDEHAQGPLWLAVPLIVIDTYEHAFYIDYQNRKAEYVERFLNFVDWAEAERRWGA